MAYGDLKVRNLIWNTGSGDNTVVLSTLATQSYVTTNFAPKANPTFTGTVTVPTAPASDVSTKAASTAFVDSYYATKAAPAFTGSATGVNLTLSGNLVVNGTTTTINTQTLDVEDINITLGKVSTPSDTTANNGGITLKGSSDKTFNWLNATDAWTSSEHIQVASGKTFIGNGSTLTNVDAATLDGDAKDKFVRTDNASSMAGQLNLTMAGAFPLKIDNNNDAKITLQGTNNPYIQFREGSTNKAEVAWSSDGYLKLNNSEDGSQLRIQDDLKFSVDGTTFYSVLTSNSTLDSTKLSPAISAAPTITATAAEALAAGDAIALKTNGQVEKVKNESTLVDPVTGSMADLNATQAWHNLQNAYDATSDKIVAVPNKGSSSGNLRIWFGTKGSGDTLTWNDDITTNLNTTTPQGHSICWLGSAGKFLLVWNEGSTRAAARVVTVDYDAPSVSLGTKLDLVTSNECTRVDVDAAGTDKAVAVVRKHSGDTVYAFALSVSSTTVSESTVTVATNAENQVINIRINDDNNAGIITYSTNANLVAKAFTYNGSAITLVGSNENLRSSETSYSSLVYTKDNKWVSLWRHSGNAAHAAVITYDPSNTSISHGSDLTVDTNISQNALAYDSNGEKVIAIYRDQNNNSGRITVCPLTISGSTMSAGTKVGLNTNSQSIVTQRAAVYVGTWNGSYGSCSITSNYTTKDLQIKSSIAGSNNDKYIGFVGSAVSSGATATVQVVGNTNSNQSSLSAGLKYYVQMDGTIGTTAGQVSVEAGYSLSATELLIKG